MPWSVVATAGWWSETSPTLRPWVRGTPFLVADGHLVMSGARDTEGILAMLEQAWDRRSPAGQDGESDGLCLPEDGVCLPESARP